jgi:hypothetical protein
MSITGIITTYLSLRLLVRRGVAVEKLASEKSAKIKTRQEAPQTIFSSRRDIFYFRIFAYFEKKGLFQQPQDFSTSIELSARNRPRVTSELSTIRLQTASSGGCECNGDFSKS